MKATKHTVTITVEVLSLDSVPALVMKACSEMQGEFINGEVTADDGDSVKWRVESEDVTF